MRKELTKIYIWELLHSTVRHVKRVQKQNEVIDVDCPSGTDYAVRSILLDIVNRFVKALVYEFELVKNRLKIRFTYGNICFSLRLKHLFYYLYIVVK